MADKNLSPIELKNLSQPSSGENPTGYLDSRAFLQVLSLQTSKPTSAKQSKSQQNYSS